MNFDVAIIGAGPAGTALGAALSRHGISIAWIAPDIDDRWPNNYGVWADELDGLTLLDGLEPFEITWSNPITWVGDTALSMQRPYARLGMGLQQGLSACVDATRFAARVTGVDHSAMATVHLSTGESIHASLVVDASGHKPALVRRSTTDPGYQTAWGAFVELEGADPLDGHDMVLMDFRPVDANDTATIPSFLYAMRFPDGRLFLEETVLVARPAVPVTELRERLERRLADRGARITRIIDEERCVIPMGHALPDFGRVVALGGAASQVHPATGYMVSRVLRVADELAATIAEGLAAGVSPEALAADAWQVVWPADRLAARRFYQFGMETLLTLSPDQTRAFFDAFFRLPAESWHAYLSDELDGPQVAAVMLKVFGNANMGTRANLMKAAMGRQTWSLVEALVRMKS